MNQLKVIKQWFQSRKRQKDLYIFQIVHMGFLVQPESTEDVVLSNFFTEEGSRMLFRSFSNHFPDYMAP